MMKPDIDWRAAYDAGAFRGDTEARDDLLASITDYFSDARNAVTPDTNLTGAPTKELKGDSVGEGKPLDFNWRPLFEHVDLTESTSEYHDIDTVSHGITFQQLAPGQPAKVRPISSAQTQIKALIHGAAMGISDRWFRYNQLYKMDRALAAALRKYSYYQANTHYGLMAALGAGIELAFDTSVEQTIDNACDTILEAIGDKYSLSDASEFTVLTNRRNASAIDKALISPKYFDKGLVSSNVNEVLETSNANIPQAHTFAAGSKPMAYVCLPGLAAESCTWMELSAEEEREASARSTDIFWYSEFNAAIGDSKQFVRIPLK